MIVHKKFLRKYLLSEDHYYVKHKLQRKGKGFRVSRTHTINILWGISDFPAIYDHDPTYYDYIR